MSRSLMLLFLAACATQQAPPSAPALRVGAPASQELWAISAPVGLTDFGRSVTSGDFNGDGFPELAIAALAVDGKGVITLWDAGGYAPALLDTLPTASPPAVPGATVRDWGADGATMVVTDLNNDGYDDLIAGDPSLTLSTDDVVPYGFRARGRIVVRLGGPGGLSAPNGIEGPFAGAHVGAALEALGDVNGDGFGDVLTSYAGSNWEWDLDMVVVLQGRADGRVDANPTIDAYATWPDSVGHATAALGDVDGDGRDDFAWTTQYRQPYQTAIDSVELAWVAGRNAISLDQSEPWRYAQPGTAATLLDVSGPGDLNGDGAPDLIVGADNADYQPRWFANTGGTFGASPTGTLRFESSDQPIVAQFGRSAGHVLAPGDVDGDGHADLVGFATQGDELLVYRWALGAGGPDALPTDVRGYPLADLGQLQVTHAAGDLDLDGRADLVVSDGAGSVHVVWGDGPEGCAPGAVATRWFLDDDGDGFVSTGHARLACAAPAGASTSPGLDCDDDDALSHPGAVDEPGFDRDCDGQVPCYADADHDGWGGALVLFAGPRCDSRWHGVSPTPGDCDDAVNYINPAFTDRPGEDNNCDGVAFCYTDLDDDGFGTARVDVVVTPGALGACADQLATRLGDCDDLDATARSATALWNPDADGDGHGASTGGVRGCHGPPGTVQGSGDCDDTNPLIHIDREELPGAYDDNCDGQIACYDDADGDGWGTDVIVELIDRVYATCDAHPDAAENPGDCDDADATMHPGPAENPRTPGDDNCNGTTRFTLRVTYDPSHRLVAHLTDGNPGDPAAVFVSLAGRGAGICPGPLGGTCLDITPAHLLGWDFGGPSGDQDLYIPVPARFSGTRIWVQAATIGSPGVVTNVVATTIP